MNVEIEFPNLYRVATDGYNALNRGALGFVG
jgi:hypothetical protein